LAFSPLARGAFRLEPIPEEYRDPFENKSLGMHCEFEENLQAGKLPSGVRNARLGHVALDRVHPLLFAVYASEDGKPFDTVVFDLNGDQDLTNDPKFSGFAPSFVPGVPGVIPEGDSRTGDIEVQIPNGLRCRMTVTLSAHNLYVKSHLWLRGKVRLDGREVDAALFNSYARGILSEEGVFDLLLDLNGNDRFETDFSGFLGLKGPEAFGFHSEVSIQGVLYDTRFDPDRMELTLTRYDGPQGKLDFKPHFAGNVKSWGMTLCQKKTARNVSPRIFSYGASNFPVALKAGNYSIPFSQLCLVLESGRRHLVWFSMPLPLEIKEGETFNLQLDHFKRFDIALAQKGHQLIVNGILEGENGVQYGIIMPLPDRPTALTDSASFPEPISGQVTIRDAQGQSLGTGALECWKGQNCEYVWAIPPTLKKGDRLKVSVMWETELFGKLEAEKEIVIEDPTSASEAGT
jgi:hypothetical protein